MPKYIVRVTDGNAFGDIEVTSDSLIDACGHAIDRVQAFVDLLTEYFDGDYDDVYVDAVRDEQDEELDVPQQFLHWKTQEIERLTAEVVRLKIKCGEA